jgi:hypothetical protein
MHIALYTMMQYITVRYSTVQHSAIQHCTVQAQNTEENSTGARAGSSPTSGRFAICTILSLVAAFIMRATTSIANSSSTSTRLAATATANDTESGSLAPTCSPVTIAASPNPTIMVIRQHMPQWSSSFTTTACHTFCQQGSKETGQQWQAVSFDVEILGSFDSTGSDVLCQETNMTLY